MQLKCAWCMKDNECDMNEGEDCPDFTLHPRWAPQVIRSSVLEVYPEIIHSVDVEWAKGGLIPDFTITMLVQPGKMLTVFERAELVMEIEQNLQTINDETLHMDDAKFTVHIAQGVEHSAEVPEGVDENGEMPEVEPIGDPTVKSYQESIQQIMSEVGDGVKVNFESDLKGYFNTGHVIKLGTLRQMEDGAVVWVRYREGGEDKDRIDGAYRINRASDTEWGLSNGSSFAADIELKGPDTTNCIDEKGGEGAMILFVAGRAAAKKRTIEDIDIVKEKRGDFSGVEVPDTLPDDVGGDECSA